MDPDQGRAQRTRRLRPAQPLSKVAQILRLAPRAPEQIAQGQRQCQPPGQGIEGLRQNGTLRFGAIATMAEWKAA